MYKLLNQSLVKRSVFDLSKFSNFITLTIKINFAK